MTLLTIFEEHRVVWISRSSEKISNETTIETPIELRQRGIFSNDNCMENKEEEHTTNHTFELE